jgi:hypothetical protein
VPHLAGCFRAERRPARLAPREDASEPDLAVRPSALAEARRRRVSVLSTSCIGSPDILRGGTNRRMHPVLHALAMSVLLCVLCCGDDNRPIPPAAHNISGSKIIRELSAEERFRICQDSARRLHAALTAEEKCAHEYRTTIQLWLSEDCDSFVRRCIERNAEGFEEAFAKCDGEAIPGKLCESTVADYDSCIGVSARATRNSVGGVSCDRGPGEYKGPVESCPLGNNCGYSSEWGLGIPRPPPTRPDEGGDAAVP